MLRPPGNSFSQGQEFSQKFLFPQGLQAIHCLLQRESFSLSLSRGSCDHPLTHDCAACELGKYNASFLNLCSQAPLPSFVKLYSTKVLCSFFSLRSLPSEFTLRSCQFPLSLCHSTPPSWDLNPAGAGLHHLLNTKQ